MTNLTNFDMYDATNPGNVPSNASYVAGYVDGAWPWMIVQPALFPNARKLTIAVFATHDAKCLDIESGNSSPRQGPSWVLRQRARGDDPIVYCSQLGTYGWQAVQDEFNSANVAHPHYWIASYNGLRTLPVLNGITAVAHQYTDVGPYDLSSLSDTFIQLVGGTVTDPIDANIAAFIYQGGVSTRVTTEAQLQAAGVDLTSLFGRVFDCQLALTNSLPKLDQIVAKLNALATEETKTDMDVLSAQGEEDSRLTALSSAIASLPAPSTNVAPTDAQMATLTTALTAAYPNYTVSIVKS